MYRKLLILLAVVFATQFPHPCLSKAAASGFQQAKGGSSSASRFTALHGPEMLYQPTGGGLRIVPVQKDAGTYSFFLPKLMAAPLTSGALPPLPQSRFSKSYIDHIYPSHHFW